MDVFSSVVYCFVNSFWLYVVYGFIGYIVGQFYFVEFGYVICLFYGSIYGVVVVFYDIKYWQFLCYSYIKGFVQCILMGSVIIKYCDVKVVCFFVFFCESDVCIDWDLSVYDVVVVKVVVFF